MVQENRDTPHAKEFEEEYRKWCEERAAGNKKKKVETIFHEVVKVCHKLWSDNDDEDVTNVNGTSEKSGNMNAVEDNEVNSSEVGASEDDDDNDDEDTKDEASSPEEDKPVFTEVKVENK